MQIVQNEQNAICKIMVNEMCMTFWYHILGKLYMAIAIVTINEASVINIPYQREGNLGDSWLQKTPKIND